MRRGEPASGEARLMAKQKDDRQRLQHVGCGVEEVRHRAARQRNAQPLEFLLQAVEGNAVRALRGDEVRHHRGRVAALLLLTLR